VRGAWWGTILGLLLGAAVGVGLLLYRGGTPGDSEPDVQQDHAAETTTAAARDTVAGEEADGDTALRATRENAIVRATKLVAPAVVAINVIPQQNVRDPSFELLEWFGLVQRRARMGSGVIVSSDGLIVTNQHVVQGAAQGGAQLIVTLSDGSQYQAVIVDEVARYDLAILRIEARGLPVAQLADSDDLQVGEWAIAIGSPFGYLLADTQPTVTVGVISAVNRDIARQNENQRTYLGMVQTDAAINPGNSGGPLVGTDGKVIGINTFIFSESGGSVGIGFAVPATRVRTVLDEIARYGRYRDISLGLGLSELGPRAIRYLRLTDPVGVLVTEVIEGGAAWRAGLRKYDVLREVGGVRLASTAMIERVVYNANVGDHIPFVAERSGKLWSGDILIEELK
jgi:serine protease Do